MKPSPAFLEAVKGAYCVVAHMPARHRVRVGSLGICEFDPGVYVYVGSAQKGIEPRVMRHASKGKKMRWHIDYLMAHAEVLSVIAVPCSSKDVECSIARAVSSSEGATVPVKGFGSSDCRCESHLMYFGDSDPEWVSETVSMALSMLECVYPRVPGKRPWHRSSGE